MQSQNHRVARIHRTTRTLAVAAAVTVAHLSLISDTRAANKTWDGGGANDNLNTPANWDADTLPAVGDSVFFAGATRLTPTASVDAQYLALFFGAGASAFNIMGPGAITLGSTTAGNYLNNDTVGLTQTISAPVNMIGGTINATQGNLVFNGNLNLGNGGTATGNGVTINTAANSVTLAGGITSSYNAATAGLTKTGSGTLLVTTDNSAYAGRVFINGGALRITNSNALGTGGGQIETALSSGGTGVGALELDGTGGPLTITKTVTTRARQDATIDNVSIRNIAGSNTINTVTTGTGGSRFSYESAGGNLTIATWNTTGSGGQRSLRLVGASTGQINNWTPAVGNIVSVIKDGTGTWTLGTGMNTADGSFGTITVNAGNLVLGSGLGARFTGANGATASVRPDVTINNGGTLTVLASSGIDGEVGNATTPGILTINAGGTLDASTFTNYSLQIAQTLVGGGTFKAGMLSAFGDNAIHIGNSTASTAVGTLNVQGNLSLSHQFASTTGGLYFNLGNDTTPGGGINDLISIQGDLQIDNSGGPIDVRLTPLPAGLTTGTYHLIEFTSGTTPSASDFNLLGFAPGTTRQSASIVTAPGQVNLSISGNPANLVWKGDGAGNVWDSAGTPNFLNGATPDKFFPFDNATFNDTSANKTVNLSGSLILGTATVNTTGTYTFTGSGSLDGGGSVTKSGSGTLIIANTGPNTYTGATTINAGTLQVGNGGTDGSLGTGAIVNNGALVINKSGDITLANVSGSGSLNKQGAGNLILNTANTYTGGTTIDAGVVQASNAAAFGDASAGTTVNAGATIYFLAPAGTYNEAFAIAGDGAAATGALRAGANVTNTLAGPVTYTGNTTLNADGGAGLNITGAFTGTGDLTKIGPGTVTIASAASAWTGNTVVSAGTLALGSAGNLVNINNGTVSLAGNLQFNNDQPLVFSRTVTGAGTITQGSLGGTTTLTGDLTGFTGTIATGNNGVASTIVVPVPTGATLLRVDDSTGGATQNGVGFGILRITNSAALAPGGALESRVAQTSGTGHFELGNNVTINAATIYLAQRNNLTPVVVSTDGNNTLSGAVTIGTGGNLAALESSAGATLTLNGSVTNNASSPRNFGLQGAGNGTVNAPISDNSATPAATTNVVKAGSGTWTLTGANTYTGSTTVNGGTLVLAPAAQASVINSPGFANITLGRLVFDYTGNPATPATLLSLLNTSATTAPAFTTGQFRTVTDAIHTLGYLDDAGASKFTVMYTYVGDLNLDGRVNGDDYALLDRGAARHLAGWSNGDVNYDGTVNAADYLAVDTAYGAQTGVLSPSLLAQRQAQFGEGYVASLVAAVPEPGSLGAIAALAALPLARRRRQK